ncbi:MAG: T9SS C-terminal target domain-containing protein [Candidatus Zixiibacteriota bacterium]|nr:MAG: T9SS C-terminal target domain-containing protein [candidate division Zixibacteria bacterium]
MRIKFLLTGLALLTLAAMAFAQPPDTLWTRTYGGGNYDYGENVQQTTDGGYIIAGGTRSFGAGGLDFYLIKTDADGGTIWTRTYGGSDDDYSESVQQTVDGGYIITGYTRSFSVGDQDVYLMKTDTGGDTIWTQTFGGAGCDRGCCIQQTADGGYIITGGTVSYGAGYFDVYLIKTDANGDSLWTRTFGGNEADEGRCVQQTLDGGYIIAGYTKSYGAGDYDVYLIKTNANGDTTWTHTFGGSNTDIGISVKQTSDEGYVIIGRTNSFGAGSYDVYLIKTDVNGDTLWTRTFGGSDNEDGFCVQQTVDGGYIITGPTSSYGAGGPDVYLVKVDLDGTQIWQQTFGGSGYDCGHCVQQTTDSGYAIAGLTDSYGAGLYDVYLIKTAAEPVPVAPFEEMPVAPRAFALHLPYPNPFNPSTAIGYRLPAPGLVSLRIYDTAGREVKTLVDGWQGAGRHEVTFDASGLPSGIYFVRLAAGEGTAVQKVVLLK